MISLGCQTLFFFILFRNLVISHSVRRSHGKCSLPIFAFSGGGFNKAKALLVDVPAAAVCTFIPVPGGRDARRLLESFCCFGSDSLSSVISSDCSASTEVSGGAELGSLSSPDCSVLAMGESGLNAVKWSVGAGAPRFLVLCASLLA